MLTSPTGILEFRVDKPSPVVALAVHEGHEVRDELLPWMAASEDLRLYEEDPFTKAFLAPYPIAAFTRTSRFETDLNRPPESAVYTTPDTCWGITLWHELPSPGLLARSYARWQEGTAAIDGLVDDAVARFGACILLDFHSYNHQRQGPVPEWWADESKPVLNIGTRDFPPAFRPFLDTMLGNLAAVTWQGRAITVGENVVFRGGYLHRRQQDRHPGRVLCPSIEVKKIFMDERTGELHADDFPIFVAQTNAAIIAALDAIPTSIPTVFPQRPFSWS